MRKSKFSESQIVGVLKEAAAGAIGGPAAYAVGARLGAVQLGDPLWLTLGTLAVIWAVAAPLLAHVASNAGPGSYRRSG